MQPRLVQIISPPLLRLSKRSLLIRAQPQDFTQRRQSGKNVKSQKVKGGNLEPTTKLDGKIALALRVVGTNFAAFFVTFCDKFCLLLNQKHLIFFSKSLTSRQSRFSTLNGKTINIRRKQIGCTFYTRIPVPRPPVPYYLRVTLLSLSKDVVHRWPSRTRAYSLCCQYKINAD